MAFRILGLSFHDTWQELWTILIVQLLFLLGIILIIPGPPVILALFFYGNRIAHGEVATERDFLRAIRGYWMPAWRLGLINLSVIGLLVGDTYLTGKIVAGSQTVHYIQGFYAALLAGWLLLQLFTIPFLFEQKEPAVFQALRNGAVFVRKNLVFVLILGLLLLLSLAAGMLIFMLTLVFGGAFVTFASNYAILEHLAD